MNESTPHRLPRLLAALLGPGVATFGAWWLFLGFDSNDYTVPQCAGLVLVLIAIGVVATRVSRGFERVAVVLSAGIGISAGCFTSWMDDDTGMFVIGWMMLTPVAFMGAALVVSLTAVVVDSRGRYQRPTRV